MTASAARRRPAKPRLDTPKKPATRRRWRPEYQGRRTVAADAAYEEVLRVGPKPAKLVEASRPKSAVLHPLFTWDDRLAAELYRRDEAREIICGTQPIIVSVDSDGNEEERATAPASFVHVVAEGGEDAEYRQIEEVMSDPRLRLRAVRHCLAQMKAMAKRYREFASVLGAIEQVEKDLRGAAD